MNVFLIAFFGIVLIGGIIAAAMMIHVKGGGDNGGGGGKKCGDKPPCQKGYTCIAEKCVETDCPTKCTPVQTCINKVCVNNSVVAGTYYIKQADTGAYAYVSSGKLYGTTDKSSASSVKWAPSSTGSSTGVLSVGGSKIGVNCVDNTFPTMDSAPHYQKASWEIDRFGSGTYTINLSQPSVFCVNRQTGNCWNVTTSSGQISAGSCPNPGNTGWIFEST
jgi:hypothetical protein